MSAGRERARKETHRIRGYSCGITTEGLHWSVITCTHTPFLLPEQPARWQPFALPRENELGCLQQLVCGARAGTPENVGTGARSMTVHRSRASKPVLGLYATRPFLCCYLTVGGQ